MSYFIKKLKYSNLKINGEVPFKTKLSFATQKEMPILHSILQKTLDSLSQKEHDAIYDQWLSIKYEKPMDYTVIILVTVIFFMSSLVLYFRNRYLKSITETDSLTKIANRRKLDEFLDIEIEKAKRSNTCVSIAIIDIDFFKNVNDTLGHKAGDTVLKKLAKLLEENIRRYELAGRWGGEEFLLVCPNSNLEQTYLLCEKLRKIVEKNHFKKLDTSITISCGVAQYTLNEKKEALVNRADVELYHAKHSGRNCVFPKLF